MALPTLFDVNYQDEEIRTLIQQLSSKVESFGKSRLVVGTDREYMIKHQIGDGVPVRKFLGVNDEDKQEIIAILNQAISNPVERNATLALREIGEYMLLATDSRFKTETDPNGKRWKPLSLRTIEEKKALGRIQKILQSTGVGRSSIDYQII